MPVRACRQQYSAERMSLVVLGGQELDELEQWVSELFSAVPAGKGARPTFFGAGMPYQVHPHPPGMLCMLGPHRCCTTILQKQTHNDLPDRKNISKSQRSGIAVCWSCMLVQQLNACSIVSCIKRSLFVHLHKVCHTVKFCERHHLTACVRNLSITHSCESCLLSNSLTCCVCCGQC